MSVDRAKYPQPIASLLADRLPELGPGTPNTAAGPQLAALTPETAFPGLRVVDTNAARCCIAALWLWHDYLDESHAISQQIHTAEGSYWHGIMHRREGDYGNSKYWMRRVGGHPVIGQLAADFPLYGDPFHFVDRCEEAVRRGDAMSANLCAIQNAEWQALFDFCLQQAVGEGPLPSAP